ncbi:MAG: phospho-N-acetylmuramoyl-pentapeptide-transferase [Lachnospiraceae bacterium]|nr:phospho-N-acetylmuramoyl-pentapeptide-transferase [Lachnospiraceae bacterium]
MNGILLIPVVVSFFLSVIFCRLMLPLLRKLKFGQQIRQEGNPEHYKKQGTLTMGGIGYLAALLVTCLIFVFRYPRMLPVLILTMGFGIIGFIDDYLKVVKKQSEGFKIWQKMLCQFILTAAFSVYCYKALGTDVIIPFTGGKIWHMGWLYIPFVMFCVLGTDTGTNFTDGLDGLCSSVTVVVALFLMLIAGNENGGIACISGAVAGVLMGFLFYNAHPAKVFMGDTGALALGGFVAGAAIMLKIGWFIIIFGIIYVIEVMSDIIQISYFHLTHGKRVFKMAPIHHHFELSGYSETQIVAMFTCITVLACIVAYWAM